ncbi:MAG: PAS domain S-box protein [Methylococcales bacterium]|nr:PAS domain S-box protein [Methylococcales bacterium]
MTVNAFDIGVLDSLTAHIAVLNVQGIIVAVNKAWRQFGTENGLPEPRHGLLGADYLNACKNITNQPDSHEANAAQAGITAVLAGEQQSFYLEYPCHSLNQQRWFSMKVSPLQGSVGGVVVSHENITERKLAEIALRDSESRFSAIIEASPVPMALNDKQGNITYLNHAFIQTLGYTLDDIPTLTNWWSCAYPDPHYQQWVIENWQNHLAEAIRSNQSFAPMEINITCKNGTVRIFMVAASILKNFAGTHLITLYDITEPKLTEESLKASESRWKFAIEGSGGGLWDWNIVNNTAFYSTFWKEMIGYSEDEIGNELEEFEQRIHPEDKSAVLIAVQNCLDGKTPIYQSEYRFCCKNGSYIWVIDRGIVIDRDEEGKPLRMIGTHIDITERKLAEETIQASKAKLEAALASMTDAVFISDAEGQLIEFNEAFATFHRFRNKKECPKMLAEYPHFIDMYSTSSGEFLPWDQRCVPRALRGETGTGVEFTLRHRDTGETWIGSYNYAPIRNDNGVIVGAVVSARDITEHKKVEAALQESEEKLRLFIHYSPSAIAMFDRDMRYLAHSHRWLIDYGLDEQTLVGRSHYEVFPDLPERWKEIHQRSLAGAIEKCERDCFVRANGFVDWIHWEMHPWLTSTGDIGGIILFSEVITERVKIEEALIASEKEFRLLAESMPQIVWITRADGWNIYFNQQWVDYTGLSLEESCGHGWNKPFHPDDQQRAWDAWQNAVNNNATYSLECQLRRTDGVYRWWLVRGIPIFDENGKVYKWFGTCTDIHKLKESEKSLRIAAIAFESQEAMVITDAKQTILKVNQAFTRMTGYSAEEAVGSTPALLKSGNQDKQFYDTMWEALNRDKFWAGEIWNRRKLKSRYGAILFIDLNDFKILNDTKGHDIGDLLLIEVSLRLKAAVHEDDTIARTGGNEFVVLVETLDKTTDLAATQAETIAKRLLAAIGQSFDLQGYTYRCSASIGIALFHSHEVNVDELVKHATMAMHQAKQGGKNTIRFFDPAVQEALVFRVQLESWMRKALNDQYELYYQMQVDDKGNATGAETLIRWHHPDMGMIAPADFIPLAEETGLILQIGRWVLKTACTQLKAWEQNQSTQHLVLAVNVSAKQFSQSDFVNQVLSVLKQTAANPHRLKLELTESMVVDNVENIITKMNTLKAIGVKFSLDDFGTGFSSLSYLKRLPLDQLKIDQSFVSDALTDSNDAAIIRTIIALGQTLGMEVIAEGVETEVQRHFLEALGCNHYQGYLFSKPLPLKEFEQLLRDKNNL